MTSERQCYVYIVLPDRTEFITAGRFRISETRDGAPRGDFVYRKRYLEQSDAVEIDLRECSQLVYDTLRPAEKPLSTREIVEAAMVPRGRTPPMYGHGRWCRRPCLGRSTDWIGWSL
jgi:hypothetical protein